MSKSLGNVIDPVELVATYGLDPVRYFLLREVPFGNDGDLQRRALIGRLNGDLANAYGNLCQRVLSIVAKSAGGKVPAKGAIVEADTALLDRAKGLLATVRAELDEQAFHRALIAIWEVIADANRYVDAQAPWALAKTDPARRDTVLWVLAETIRRVDLAGAALHAGLGGQDPRPARRAGRPSGRSRASTRSCASGTGAAGAAGRVPALRRARPRSEKRGGKLMLIDSHCHLDFPELATDETGVLARARTAGVGRHADHRHQARPVRQGARHRRAPRQRLVLGRRPSARGQGGGAAHARPPDRGARAIPRSSASARPGSTSITSTARAPSRPRASAPISRRRARPACR